MTTVAIMQPYLYPYIGYFQLIAAADIFVILDDVQYIRRGWVNRNQVLLNGKPMMISIPVAAASQSTPINQIHVAEGASRAVNKLRSTLRHSYGNCLGWSSVDEAVCIINQSLPNSLLFPVLEQSINHACKVLGVHRSFVLASTLGGSDLRREDRIIHLVKKLGGTHYINLPGGYSLYDYSMFRDHGLELSFIKPILKPYPQKGTEVFVPALSVLDLMANFAAEDLHLFGCGLS